MQKFKNWNYDPHVQSVAIIGASQHGKTEHAKWVVKILRSGNHNVLILDPNFKFTALAPRAIIKNLNEVTGQGLQILQPHQHKSIPAMHQFFADLCSLMHSKKNIVFVIDELHNWFATKQTPVNEMELFCRNCHNNRSSYVAIFQAPAEIPNYILRNAEHRFCLYLDLPTDIDYMVKFIGKVVTQFPKGEIPKYSGIYKRQGEKPEMFEVQKS